MSDQEIPHFIGEGHLGGCVVRGDPDCSAPEIWDALIAEFNSQSVLDIGCGCGHALKYFLDKGLRGAGVDGYQLAIDYSPVKDKIILHDYSNGPLQPAEPFDLGWCCEFVEHVRDQYVPNFIATFQACQVVAMTHAVPGQGGFHHVNCQDDAYWLRVMSAAGFEYSEDFSLRMRRLIPPDIGHGMWVSQSLMVFRNIGGVKTS